MVGRLRMVLGQDMLYLLESWNLYILHTLLCNIIFFFPQPPVQIYNFQEVCKFLIQMAMDSESDGWLSVSDSFTSDQSDSVGCIHKKIVDGDDVLAEVQPSKLIADCQDCLECKIIRQAIEEFKPGFIDESMTGNHTIEVSWVEKQPGDFESLVKVRLRRCPRKEYRPEDEEYWAEYIPEEDPDLIDQFEIVRKSTSTRVL